MNSDERRVERRRTAMRSLLAMLAVMPLYVGAGACGGSRKVAGSASHRSTGLAVSDAMATASAARARLTLSPPKRPSGRHLNDGDHDPLGDEDGDNSRDRDKDAFLDHRRDENGDYHDSDDRLAFAFGNSASPTDRRTITAVVKRYYAAAAAGGGRRACSLLPQGLAKSIPMTFGRSGPSYLRGGNTCETVLVRLFAHRHRELAAPVAVTEVRVKGDDAYALLTSRTMPASYITLRRLHGAWTTDEMLGVPLP